MPELLDSCPKCGSEPQSDGDIFIFERGEEYSFLGIVVYRAGGEQIHCRYCDPKEFDREEDEETIQWLHNNTDLDEIDDIQL